MQRAHERSLCLDMHTEQHGYTEAYVPYLVNADSMQEEQDSYPSLQETSFARRRRRVVLDPDSRSTRDQYGARYHFKRQPNSYRSSIVAHTPCFRSEAGSHGRDVQRAYSANINLKK